jgi:hypothetical protein
LLSAGLPDNGMQSTRTDCKKQFESGQLRNIVSRIRDRGIVFAFGLFDHETINWFALFISIGNFLHCACFCSKLNCLDCLCSKIPLAHI